MSPWQLWWFDLRVGLPTALGLLRRRLGWRALAGVLLSFVWRDLTTSPFRPLGKPAGPGERFTRHQLKPVLLLHDALRARGHTQAEALALLGHVVAQTGARFVRYNIPHPTPQSWGALSEEGRRAFAGRILQRFGNAEAQVVAVGERSFAMDVTRCHFVELTARLGRRELAPLFCAADSVVYSHPSMPVALQRDETLAGGHARCAFRFAFRDDQSGGS